MQSQQFGNQYYPQVPAPGQQPFEIGMQRTESMDSNMSPYPAYSIQAPMYPSATMPINPLNMQQIQYQQNLLARGNQPANNFYPNLSNGYGNYGTASPAIDNFRNQNGMPNGSPIQPAAQMNTNFGPAAAGFGMNVGNGFAGGYPGMPGMGMQNMGGYMQAQQQEAGRRGRVCIR